MAMLTLKHLVVFVPWFLFVNCSAEQIVSWPSSLSTDKNITSMTMIRDGQVLLISGYNHLFTVNATSFQLINDVITGPINGTNYSMRAVVYNKTEQNDVAYVTMCNNSFCEIRKESDITNVAYQLENPIPIDGTQAFMTSFNRPGQLDKFLFVACPHAEVQENRCSTPGIIWYLNNGNDKPKDWRGFKSFAETPVRTEKYIDAFIVGKYKLFFSIQFEISTKKRNSRVAQVCQNVFKNKYYTTQLTYADMPIECGQFKKIQAVRKIMLEGEIFFIAVFSYTENSSVCVYSMNEAKQKFVENVKDCYSGKRVNESYDYINFRTTSIPCNKPYKESYSSKTEDYFLCNEDALDKFQQVVGTHTLFKEPAATYNTSLTTLTVTVVDSKIIAFLGTTSGDILKAVVYPSNSTRYIQQNKIPNIGNKVKKDMYTSSDGKHIYALTETKAFKIPVESCSEFLTCRECLVSKDPYCGWCFLEERCSTVDACPNRKWISASSHEVCPHITNMSHTVMSVDELQKIHMRVSHELQGVSVSCSFHSEEIGPDIVDIQEAKVSDDKLSVRCTPVLNKEIKSRIRGYLNVTVTVLVNNTATTFQGHFDIFNCEAFESCMSCTAEKWRCQWCAYTNKCKNDSVTCDYYTIEADDECPRITNYTVVTGGSDVYNPTGSVHFSRVRDYTINITGTNLIEPRTVQGSLKYKCKVVVSGTQVLWFDRTNFYQEILTCNLDKDEMSKISSLEDEVDAKIQVMWGDSPIYGDTMLVKIYACERLAKPANNCGHCNSFAMSKPYYTCHWCMDKCVDSSEICNSTACGRPVINEVFPLSVHINATTLITLKGSNLGSVFRDINESVTVAGIPCTSVESGYSPGIKIECKLPPSYKTMNGSLIVTRRDNARGEYLSRFYFRVPKVTSIKPFLGPISGGTLVTIYGQLLDTGRKMTVSIGGKPCKVDGSNNMRLATERVCTTTAGDINDPAQVLDVEFDGASAVLDSTVNFSYVQDPNITDISPRESFKSGGRRLTISGERLYSIQKPKIYIVVDNNWLKTENCERGDNKDVIYCPSPRYFATGKRRRKRSARTSAAEMGFQMDDVSFVKGENLPSNLSLMYYEDPIVQNFTEDKYYTEYLSVKGERFKVAAEKTDVVIEIGCETCNVTSMADDLIICQPPAEEPICSPLVKDHKLAVNVYIGYLKRNVGYFIYHGTSKKQPDDSGRKTEYIIAGSVVGILLLFLGIFMANFCVMMKKRKRMKKEKVSLEYKMDNLEAKFRNQCREEFAALQTAVSDLTSDLEGGNVLFRDYDVYASKILFTSQKSDILTNPPLVFTDQTQQAMDTFKGLLCNRQFLLLFIKTLENENTFTIHDKSNVATIITILHHDNMEYVTGILTTLLDELIEKNISSQTPKLLLRRSECVAEKLLTHWLSICLYHYLKECSGSALYILYKAIKIQTEKGPIDYITNCGKYTLSEDNLCTSADTEINPITLTLDVRHHDFIEDKEKQISVQVLDCDTISQAKGKIIEILYKNVPYSQRPSVHSTSLELREGSKSLLNDEDESTIRDGIWKRINTLQHYKIQDGTKVNLFLSSNVKGSNSAMPTGVSPDSFIIESFGKTKPVVRTISGSNFWHLTKKHQTDDEVQLASDLFLPRLLYTKGTLQTYIDDLFQAVLTVESDPPIIIKFLFDYLDSAASRWGIKDPDVLHTWKCNSLLLRFWVNIIKNPEFVFDVHKPLIVDSCLSVVAQTLMDSCSTADLILGPSSPSNKLLFAKDIPRYKGMVRQCFADLTSMPAVSDQDLNSYLTQKVSQKFYGKFNQSSAIIEMYKYASKYRNEIYNQINKLGEVSPGIVSSLTPKLDSVFKSMDASTTK